MHVETQKRDYVNIQVFYTHFDWLNGFVLALKGCGYLEEADSSKRLLTWWSGICLGV